MSPQLDWNLANGHANRGGASCLLSNKDEGHSPSTARAPKGEGCESGGQWPAAVSRAGEQRLDTKAEPDKN